jgi:hypothetical protein
MLITDPRYVVPVEVVPGAPRPTTTTTRPAVERPARVGAAGRAQDAADERAAGSRRPPRDRPGETHDHDDATRRRPRRARRPVQRDTGSSRPGRATLPQVDLLADARCSAASSSATSSSRRRRRVAGAARHPDRRRRERHQPLVVGGPLLEVQPSATSTACTSSASSSTAASEVGTSDTSAAGG